MDFTVKITYLELYNEELTDLLADTTTEQPEKIKIYEDKEKVNNLFNKIPFIEFLKCRQTQSSVQLKPHVKHHLMHLKF